jgi:hypothetical protein
VIQKPAQHFLALYRGQQSGLSGVIKTQRDDVADTLMGSTGVMVLLDVAQGVTKVGLAQENQLVERLSDLAYLRTCRSIPTLALPPHQARWS